jgi:hypothetical protein
MIESTTTNIPAAQDPLRAVIEEVWATLREVSESQKETDRKFQETRLQLEETGRQVNETTRQMKATNKRLGFLTNRFGELAEHLVAPNIHKRFNELGYHFGSCAPGGLKVYDEKGNTRTEIDLLLENGSTIMALEVKTKPVIKDVEHHIKRLEILRENRSMINDNRVIKGAIAGAIFGSEEKKATIEAGLYVVEQSGDTMRIDVPEGFQAREW